MPLAVVIPAAPDSPWVEACVASVRQQTDGTIYVVSDGRPLDDSLATLVTAPADAGFAQRANLGLLRALVDGAERALLLNDDTLLVPGAIDALQESSAPVCGAVLEHWDGGVQQAGLDVSMRTARVLARTVVGEDVTVDAVSGAAMCIDLALFEKLSGFDSRYHFYFEDIDFCLRARARGARVELVPAARVRHRGGGTRSHHSNEAAFHLGRSHAMLARELGGGPGQLLRLMTVASAGSAWTVRSVGFGGIRSFVRGFAEGVTAA
ncbi:MAG: glycosyltransferase family 2 protein [Deltaproteobacteria bacterium]|nr:glycosyltransferase family 2 protein [Deltaproteobacteria bacterium]